MENFKENKFIDSILESYRSVIGKDYKTYNNHVYRIYHLSLSMDSNPVNQDKYAIAAAFHDLGIWTDSFDYLEPSIKMSNQYLIENKLENWAKEIELMIDNHHKRSFYKGKYSKTIETFRRADWLDVTMGLKMYDVKKDVFMSIKKQYPINGFHWFLVKQSTKYFFKHPLNPLPMFKK